MASSRIFIKGLPPSITEADFKKHFALKSQITDAKLIPNRRIGYIGFKTVEEAEKAVKYFNKSFIRMSKIAVEIARPISDAELPPSRKVLRERAREAQKVANEKREKAEEERTNLKRKRTEVDRTDAKLQEFLDVMQPASKSRTWATSETQDQASEPPAKVQAIEMPEAESDDEYESVPKKPKKEVIGTAFVAPVPAAAIVHPLVDIDQAPEGSDPAEAKDDDNWLRSRTSRLLDIVDADDLPVPGTQAITSIPTPQDEQPEFMDVVQQNVEPIVEDQQKEDNEDEQVAATADTDAIIEQIKSNGRIFVRNLPYSATEDDLRDHFAKHGALEEVHLPLDAAGVSKGFLLVQFADPLAAAEAYHNLDGEPFQGRLLHILPAAAKRENKLDDFAISKLPLKKQREIKKKAEASKSTFNWNSLYMNQDAINSSMADRLGVSKSELLDPTSSNAGVKQAIAETSIIQETKTYFAKNGVDLDAFKQKARGDTAILVKNFPYGMTLEELRRMFEEFGQVLRVLMPPTGTIAIVEFAQPPQARAAFGSLAYRRMKDSVLFLEKAPKDLFTESKVVDGSTEVTKTGVDAKVSAADLFESQSGEIEAETTTLFVRNLNFTTSSAVLTDLFKPLNGFLSAKVKTKTDAKKPGQVLSMGFGFVEFSGKAEARAALSAMDGWTLEGHKLLIKASHKGVDAAEERKQADKAKKLAGKRTKIIVKNLPFEASKQDIRSLFGTYGKLRSVRMPKKFDNSTRGFAFADFVTAREAENALESLKDTHLLGRRLVLDFASEDVVDAEEEIEKMQKKVGKQQSKMEMQKLTGGGRNRSRFNIEGSEDAE